MATVNQQQGQTNMLHQRYKTTTLSLGAGHWVKKETTTTNIERDWVLCMWPEGADPRAHAADLSTLQDRPARPFGRPTPRSGAWPIDSLTAATGLPCSPPDFLTAHRTSLQPTGLPCSPPDFLAAHPTAL